MRDFIRFLFSGNDVHQISLPVKVDDVPPKSSPALSDQASGTMKLSFRQLDPGPVQIRPLLPGTIRFLVDNSAPGILPVYSDVSLTTAAFTSWKTIGRILIEVNNTLVTRELDRLAVNLPVKPNMIWYGPVQLSEQFLFETILQKLPKQPLPISKGLTISINNPLWKKYAISEFLAGRYAPSLVLGTDATKDSIVKCNMPTVVVPPGGDIELFITTALSKTPQDGPMGDFNDPANPISKYEPLHPQNGLIPAREVYRQLRSKMVSEPASELLRDSILADWPAAPRFFPITLTRTWEVIPNCSVHFVKNTVILRAGVDILHEERIPAHGIVFLKQAPSNTLPPPPVFEFSLSSGDMKWLKGGPGSWREMGSTNPLVFDLSIDLYPHVCLRLPMTKAMFSDPNRPAPHGNRCTYLSMRRTVRALVDNRIAGGRLNYGVVNTSAVTLGIIKRAFNGTPAHENMVANNAPNPFGDPNLALNLEPVLQAFFPTKVVQQVSAGPAPANPIEYDQGQMAYRLWQTMIDRFESDASRRNFDDAHIGRGGPGAAVALGLATYHVDPVRNPGESDQTYFNRIVQEMKTGLTPGALLQFWNNSNDYDDIKSRSIGGRQINYGHSPLFVDYVKVVGGIVSGLVILDQHVDDQGKSYAPVSGGIGAQLLTWAGFDQQIWIAANWKE